MSASIHVPDELYRELSELAGREGRSVDEIIVSALRQRLHETQHAGQELNDTTTDPLMEFSGIGSSDDPTWVDEHDRHLADLVGGDAGDGC